VAADKRANAASAVLEFDAAGTFVQGGARVLEAGKPRKNLARDYTWGV
jgi:hypothetical protein